MASAKEERAYLKAMRKAESELIKTDEKYAWHVKEMKKIKTKKKENVRRPKKENHNNIAKPRKKKGLRNIPYDPGDPILWKNDECQNPFVKDLIVFDQKEETCDICKRILTYETWVGSVTCAHVFCEDCIGVSIDWCPVCGEELGSTTTTRHVRGCAPRSVLHAT